MGSLNRRNFIKISSAGVAAVSGLTSDWWGLDAPHVHNPMTDGDRVVPTFSTPTSITAATSACCGFPI